MAGRDREIAKDTKIQHRPDKSPTRSRGGEYRERSRDRSAVSSRHGSKLGGIAENGYPRTPKKDAVDETVDPENETGEERGRSLARSDTKDGDGDDIVQDVDDSQSISDMNNQEMMMKMMGFGNFDTTKGKHVSGVGSGVAKKNKATKYRQYMNRDKGFNRALSPDRKK